MPLAAQALHGQLRNITTLNLKDFSDAFCEYDHDTTVDWFTSLSRQQLLNFADGLLHQVKQALGVIYGEVHYDGDEEPEEDLLEFSAVAVRCGAHLAADLARICHKEVPEALYKVAVELHDRGCLALGERDDVQHAVANLCCLWWQLDMAHKDSLMSNTLVYYLLRALRTGKVGDIHQCYLVRDALALFDYDDPSIRDTKRLLVQVAFAHSFLRRPEGRRLIAHTFTLHPQLVRELTCTVKNQITTGRRSVLDAYGEILYRAWRACTGACLYELEEFCIQGLMQAALLASTDALALALRRVLEGFHKEKNMPGVAALLLRLYEPILFRGLDAANAAVRRNAVELLVAAFPLMDPAAPSEDTDALLSRQFTCLGDALTDPAPAVRISAIHGVCSLLNLYWEMIPIAATSSYIKQLTTRLSFDGAAVGVRVAVLQGLSLLVDNQHAEPVMKRVLPGLAPLMHDTARAVREAMADLLLCISTSRNLHFYDIVPLESLLQVLAADEPAVAQRVHNILVPSYLPGPEEGPARLAALLRAHPAAGRSFCQLLADAPVNEPEQGGRAIRRVRVPVEQLLSVVRQLMQHLLSVKLGGAAAEASEPKRRKGEQQGARARSKQAQTGKRKKSAAPASPATGGDADGSEPTQRLASDDDSPDNADSWSAILAGAAELSVGLAAAVEREECTEQDLQAAFPADCLLQLLEACPTSASRESVWQLATALPFLKASEQLRTQQIARVAAGQLPELGEDDRSGRPEDDSLCAMLASIAAAPVGAKLAAVLCHAMHVEWKDPVQLLGQGRTGRASSVPVAAEEGSDDDDDTYGCRTCGRTQPEDNMLLCDGCDAAYHTTCLQPPLAAVPEGSWFCHGCELDIRGARLQAGAAVRCTAALLATPTGRAMLFDSCKLARLQPALQQHAQQQLEAACVTLQQAGSGPLTLEVGEHLTDGLRACATSCKVAMHLALPHAPGLGIGTSGAAAQDAPSSGGSGSRREPGSAIEPKMSGALLCSHAQLVAQVAEALTHSITQQMEDEAASWCDSTESTAQAVAQLSRLMNDVQQNAGLWHDTIQLQLLHQDAGSQITSSSLCNSTLKLLKLLAVAEGWAAKQEMLRSVAPAIKGCLVGSTALVQQLTLAWQASPSPTVEQALKPLLQEWMTLLLQPHTAGAVAAARHCLPSVLGATLPSTTTSQGWLRPVLSTIGRLDVEDTPAAVGVSPPAANTHGSTGGRRGRTARTASTENDDPNILKEPDMGAQWSKPQGASPCQGAWMQALPSIVPHLAAVLCAKPLLPQAVGVLLMSAETAWTAGAVVECLGALRMLSLCLTAAKPARPLTAVSSPAGAVLQRLAATVDATDSHTAGSCCEHDLALIRSTVAQLVNAA